MNNRAELRVWENIERAQADSVVWYNANTFTTTTAGTIVCADTAEFSATSDTITVTNCTVSPDANGIYNLEIGEVGDTETKGYITTT